MYNRKLSDYYLLNAHILNEFFIGKKANENLHLPRYSSLSFNWILN